MKGNRSNTWGTKAAKSCKNFCSTWGKLAHTSYACPRATKDPSTDAHRTCIFVTSEVLRKAPVHMLLPPHNVHLRAQPVYVRVESFTIYKMLFFSPSMLCLPICLPNYFWQDDDNLGAELLKKPWGQTHRTSVKEQAAHDSCSTSLLERNSINSKPLLSQPFHISALSLEKQTHHRLTSLGGASGVCLQSAWHQFRTKLLLQPSDHREAIKRRRDVCTCTALCDTT